MRVAEQCFFDNAVVDMNRKVVRLTQRETFDKITKKKIQLLDFFFNLKKFFKQGFLQKSLIKTSNSRNNYSLKE